MALLHASVAMAVENKQCIVDSNGHMAANSKAHPDANMYRNKVRKPDQDGRAHFVERDEAGRHIVGD